MPPAIKIIGIARLLYKFEKLGKIDMTPAVGKAVALVQGSAKSKALVDTGELVGSISKEVVRSLNGGVTGRVFTNKEYAPFVEFGTGRKGDGTYPYKPEGVALTYRQTNWAFMKDGELIWTSGQVAHPFMYPALSENKNKIKKLLREEYTLLLATQAKK